ncbi:MAG: hypothetical protein GC134_02185 [Proteobacteria bacterium]|nr:hypothetical protein [Pseudomonadota bacterium]
MRIYTAGMERMLTVIQSKPVRMTLVLALLAFVWLGGILPLNHRISTLQDEAGQQSADLYDIRRMGGEIKQLEQSLSDEQRKGSFGAPLQQLERLAQTHRLSSRMSRVTPVRVSDGESSRNGLDVVFDDVSLAAFTPFLHALTYQSLLRVENLTMRSGTQQGTMVIQLRLSGDGA